MVNVGGRLRRANPADGLPVVCGRNAGRKEEEGKAMWSHNDLTCRKSPFSVRRSETASQCARVALDIERCESSSDRRSPVCA